MGFAVEDVHLIKCLRVSSSNEYLTLTSMECLIPCKHTLKILYKPKHFPRDIKENVSGVFFFDHSVVVKSFASIQMFWHQ